MPNIIKNISLLFCLILLASCGEKTQTVEWYLEHKDVLKKEVERCRAKGFEAMLKDKHCQIIEQAREKDFNAQQRNAPLPQFNFK